MTFAEFAVAYGFEFFSALDGLDINRLAELADRGDKLEIGSIVHHAIEREKDLTEQRIASGTHSSPQTAIADAPAMLRKQAD
jgi:hypothetical protein